MLSRRISLFLLSLSLSAPAFADPDAQKTFDNIKTLAGTWEGAVTTDPPEPSVQGKPVHVTLRVTSLGNALLHEMKVAGRPDDPITMLYLDDNRLLLTHYCDAGNRPRMIGKMSPDGKTFDFSFLDVAGSLQYGHMHHTAFNVIDPKHHTEDWSFMVGDKMTMAHFDLKRIE